MGERRQVPEGFDARSSDDAENDRLQKGDYEVGYGKPPKHTQFAKGHSGNPRGRPRKSKPLPLRLSDAPSDLLLEAEVYRTVALRENGEAIELPALQAVLRAMTTAGIKGNRLTQKALLELVSRKEEVHFQEKIERYKRLTYLKEQGEKTLAYHKSRGLTPPSILPHPEDIVLNPTTGDAFIAGPQDSEGVAYYEHLVRLRDHVLLRSVDDAMRRRRMKWELANDGFCIFRVYAMLLNTYLRPRYRASDWELVQMMLQFEDLSVRERKRRLAVEFAALKDEEHRHSRLSPDLREKVDQLAARMVRQKGSRKAELE